MSQARHCGYSCLVKTRLVTVDVVMLAQMLLGGNRSFTSWLYLLAMKYILLSALYSNTIHQHADTHKHTLTHSNTHTHTNTHKLTRTNTHTHTHTHTLTHRVILSTRSGSGCASCRGSGSAADILEVIVGIPVEDQARAAYGWLAGPVVKWRAAKVVILIRNYVIF